LKHRELIEEISNRTEVKYNDVRKVMKALKDIFWEQITGIGKFSLRAIGSFRVKEMPSFGGTNLRILYKKPKHIYLNKGKDDAIVLTDAAYEEYHNKKNKDAY
jgi:nucleoid DNA-binding protein